MVQKKIPQHVAIIMDGNGRWAKEKGLLRIKGHEKGTDRVEEIARHADKIGVRYLTLYAFSKENWKRPEKEVSFLMRLLSKSIDERLGTLIRDNVQLRTIGDLRDLPETLQQKLADSVEKSKTNTGLVLTLALSYSSRWEIVEAARKIARKIHSGEAKEEDISETFFSSHLATAGYPDPDLLIRTSGEMRISNFLLWQLSYSEIFVTPKYWPDFTPDDFDEAVEEFSKRERRFGLTEAPAL